MSSEEEYPYSPDFEHDESSKAAPKKFYNSTEDRYGLNSLARSKSKSDSVSDQLHNSEPVAGLNHSRRDRSKSSRNDGEDSVEEMDSFSADLTSQIQGDKDPNQQGTAPNKNFTEIEEILLKLEKLEKAHNELESAVGLSEIEEEGSLSSPLSYSAASLPSKSVTTSMPKPAPPLLQKPHAEVEDISLALSTEIDSIRELLGEIETEVKLRRDSDTDNQNTSEVAKSQSRTGDVGSDRSIDELLHEYDDLEKHFVKRDIGSGDGPTSSISIKLMKEKSPYETAFKVNAKAALTPGLSKKVASNSNYTSNVISHLPPKVPTGENSDNKTNNSAPRRRAVSVSKVRYGTEGTQSLPRSSSAERSTDPPSKKARSVPLPPSVRRTAEANVQTEEEIKDYGENEKSQKPVTLKDTDFVVKMKLELERQTALTESYQKENNKLYSQHKASQEESQAKESQLLDQVNRLKTEIATIKLNSLLPAISDKSNQIVQTEVDQLKMILSAKTQQVVDLHREIACLKLEAQKAKPVSSGRPTKQNAAVVSQEKEKEYHKTIRSLQKQVRTLQKIMYHKDPSAVMSSSRNEVTSKTTNTILSKFGSKDNGLDRVLRSGNKDGSKELQLAESRVAELEKELAKADSTSNEKLKEFQLKFSSLRTKYDERIQDLEKRFEESENRIKAPELGILEESNSKLDKAQAEISQLKLEICRCRRELEIAAKSNAANSSTQSNTKQDAGTLSLAIKSFKAELSEKDKELIRIKKEMADLRKTNFHFKKEREKYLSSGGSNVGFLSKSSLLNRTKSDLIPSVPSQPNSTVPSRKLIELSKKPNSAGSVPKLNSGAFEMMQATLESERSEFEDILSRKNRIIQENENMIAELKHKIQNVGIRRDSCDEKMLEELRSRVTTQNKIIQALKEHITSKTSTPSELASLKKEKGILEFRIRELSQELTLARSLNKPENEILSDLSEKVDNLNSRYHYREKQLDLLLNLAAKSGSYSSSLVSDLVHGSSTLDTDMALLSPTTSMQLLSDPPFT